VTGSRGGYDTCSTLLGDRCQGTGPGADIRCPLFLLCSRDSGYKGEKGSLSEDDDDLSGKKASFPVFLAKFSHVSELNHPRPHQIPPIHQKKKIQP
jgi:hypothetical protein